MDMQKVVRDLFAKAASTHSEHEAQSAIMKAHELMAKYGITQVTSQDDIRYVSERCRHPGNKSFRRTLAGILAPNFRVKYYLSNMNVTFFGHEEDVRVAKEVFEYAYSFACRETRRICNEMRANHFKTNGITNSYALGFCRGLKEKLDSQSVALMVVTPPDVETEYKEMSKGFKTLKHKLAVHGYADSVYKRGLEDGWTVLNGRRIEDKTA